MKRSSFQIWSSFVKTLSIVIARLSTWRDWMEIFAESHSDWQTSLAISHKTCALQLWCRKASAMMNVVPLADVVTKYTATCFYCKDPAPFTLRTISDERSSYTTGRSGTV